MQNIVLTTQQTDNSSEDRNLNFLVSSQFWTISFQIKPTYYFFNMYSTYIGGFVYKILSEILKFLFHVLVPFYYY